MTDLAQRRQQLEDRLKALDERMHEIGDELESHQSKDWEELATEREGDEVLEQLGLSAQEETIRIQAALKRMDEDEYGFCTKCGEEISQARLDLLPWTPFCRRCAI